MKKATITVQIYDNATRKPMKRANGEIIVVEVETTTDLPADALGEALTSAVRAAWQAGLDPVDFNAVVRFS